MSEFLITPFAKFAAEAGADTFPALARQRAVDAIVDCFGCILGGLKEPLTLKTLELVPRSPASLPPCSAALVGQGYAPASSAALFHGAAAHALDFDDTNHPAYAHPSAVLVSALLAVAPLVNATGRDFVTAYIAGFDLIGKLGRVLNTSHYARGWHATNTFGSLAAALAVGSLLRLSEEEIGRAVAVAASMAGGIRANFGTMMKPLHAGLAARSGVEAAILARNGFSAAPDAMEHRFGYLAVFAGEDAPRSEHLLNPGDPLEILTEYGLALKPYPACGATHPGIEAAIRLRSRLQPVEEIERVHIGISAMARNPLIYDRPRTGLEGKFSMQFCVAAALLDGEVNLGTFADERVRRADATDLVERTIVAVDERVRDSSEFATSVRIVTNAGREDEELVPLALGKPERWMTPAQLSAKFEDCARYGGAPINSHAALATLTKLDSDLPLFELTDLVAAGWNRELRGNEAA